MYGPGALDLAAGGAGGEGARLAMKFEAAQAKLRQVLSGLEGVRADLYVVHGSLPAAPEDLGTEDSRSTRWGRAGCGARSKAC